MRFHQDKSINLFSAEGRLHDLTKIGDSLYELSRHIDFEFFRSPLEQGLYGDYKIEVRDHPPFDPVMMFKVLVLQRLYNLSDDAIFKNDFSANGFPRSLNVLQFSWSRQLS